MIERLVLAGVLAATLGCCSVVLRYLAKGLGLRMPRRVAIYGVVVSMGVLAPWLLRSQLLTATDFLSQGLVPGAPVLESSSRYELLNDQVLQFLPWEIELRRLWAAGQWGFWSDSLEGGSSPWSNPQASVLSPSAWVARAFPIERFFLVKIAVQLLVCFLGTALLVRRLGGSWTGGSLAGLAAVLGGGMIPWATFTHTAAAAWVPWTTAGLVTMTRHPNRRSIACTGLLISFLLLSGHPEVAFGGGVLGVLVAFSVRSRQVLSTKEGAGRGASRAGSWRMQLGAVLLAASIGFLLAAPAVFPFLGALGGSQRAAEVGVHQQDLAGVELGLAPSSWFLSGSARLGEVVLHPFAFGRPFLDEFSGALNWLEAGAGYAGIFALAGAALGIGLGMRRVAALLGFCAVAVLLAAGFIPLLWLARALPGFSAMAFPRALLVSSIAMSAAAGLAFDAVRRVQLSVLAWASMVVVAAASVWSGGVEYVGVSALVWSLIFVVLFFGEPRSARYVEHDHGEFPAFRRYSPGQARWRLCLLGVVLLGQLPWTWLMLPTSNPTGFYPPSNVFLALAATAEEGLSDVPQRVLGAGFLGYPSLLSVYGFHQTRSHNPMAPTGWLRVNQAAFGFAPDAAHYFSEVNKLDGTWLDVLGIRAVLTTEAGSQTLIDSPAVGLELAARLSPFLIYRNPNAMERWFPARTWEVVEEESLPGRLAQLKDARHVLVSESAAGAFLGAHLEGAERFIALPDLIATSSRPGAADIEVEWPGGNPPESGFLLATTLAGPGGWRVQAINAVGEKVSVESTKVHGAFLGAWIPSEVREIQLRFAPPLLGWGLAAFLVGLLLVTLLLTTVVVRGPMRRLG